MEAKTLAAGQKEFLTPPRLVLSWGTIDNYIIKTTKNKAYYGQEKVGGHNTVSLKTCFLEAVGYRIYSG
jgi:hypothetical protein